MILRRVHHIQVKMLLEFPMEIEERLYYVVFRATVFKHQGKAKERLIELLLRGLPGNTYRWNECTGSCNRLAHV